MTDYIVEDCGWCQGSGNVPCDCEGHNEECCAWGGDGYHTCPQCNGTGQVTLEA